MPISAQQADQVFNQWYIKPLMEGAYPSVLDSLPDAEKPDILPGDLELIAHPLDFLGINYYTRAIYRADRSEPFVRLAPANGPVTEMGWEIYPQAFTELLVSLDRQYRLPPVYITENGAAVKDFVDQGQINDVQRVRYFQEHLDAVARAMEQGRGLRKALRYRVRGLSDTTQNRQNERSCFPGFTQTAKQGG